MKQLRQLIIFIVCSIALCSATSVLAEDPASFKCPTPAEIQAVNFGDPTIWVAPPVENTRNEVGVGLGGKVVGAFIAAEPYQELYYDKNINVGWYCIYETQNSSLHEYEVALRKTAESVLNSYPDQIKKAALKKLDTEFNHIEESRQPFLKKYADRSVGFVRYRYSEHYLDQFSPFSKKSGLKK